MKADIKSTGLRNEVLDFLRGHYMVAIIISHFNRFPSIFGYYNGRGSLWVSAAEGFVFISGILLGMIHFPKFEQLGFWPVANKIWKRAFQLYVINILFTLIYSLIGTAMGSGPYLNQGIVYTDFPSIVFNAMIFNYSYGWVDILILYAMLLFLTPFIMWAMHKKFTPLVLSISFILWLYAILTPDIQRYGGSYFPLISWQFVFTIGLAIGKHREFFSKLYRKILGGKKNIPAFLLLSLFSVTIWLSYLDLNEKLRFIPRDVIKFVFSRLELGPGRLILFFIWFLFFYSVIHTFYPFLKKHLGFIYLTFGKNSLLTYLVHSFVLFGWFYIDSLFPRSLIVNNLLNVWMLAVIWIIVKGIIWYNQQVKSHRLNRLKGKK